MTSPNHFYLEPHTSEQRGHSVPSREVRRDTAAHKLTMLRLPAVLDLFVCHLSMRRDLDPDALEKVAERINDLATEARRTKMRATS